MCTMAPLLFNINVRWTAPLLRAPPKWAWFLASPDGSRSTSSDSSSSTSSGRRSADSSPMLRVLVTGGTDGIGREAAMRFAQLNHHVTISGRDRRKADDVIEQCVRLYNNTPHFIQVDFSQSEEVIRFAERAARIGYDICILNAGTMMPANARCTADRDRDRDTTMMTNLVSSYMIAHRILDHRKCTNDQRDIHFVFTTSLLVKFHGVTPFYTFFFNPSEESEWRRALRPDDSGSGVAKYAYSKIGLATLATCISRLALPHVTATSVHPGTVETNIMANLSTRHQRYIRFFRRFCTSLPEAGANLVRAASEPLPVGWYYDASKAAELPDVVSSAKSCEAFDAVFEQFRIANQ